jgi:dihydrofolate reductase
MIITLIAAMGRNRVIGDSGEMPWNLPREMRHFVRTTKGHPIIVGRTTFGSWGARSLPKRKNIVLTRNADFRAPEGVHVAGSIDAALALVEPSDKVFICGGAVVYQAFLPLAGQMVLTHINAAFEGDTLFPHWGGEPFDIVREEAHSADTENPYDYVTRWYVRNRTAHVRTDLA